MDSSPERYLDGEELMTLVRETVARGQSIRYLPFRGVSMLPMLRQGIDAVEVSPLPAQLKKYDLPVYQLPTGKYVMHRIVGVTDKYYICRGDNLVLTEHVCREQMIALVTAFTRNGKRVEISAPIYQLYCRFWCGIWPLRRLWRWTRGKLRRLIRGGS